MNRCIQLAQLGEGCTKSNPLVGSVLVYDNKIIGEGYHQKYGEAHAEVNCLNSVAEKNKHLIPKATLYVNLEPCNHIGKTPPCSHAIVKAGIKKVVVGTQDLNPIVEAQGINYLQENNVDVLVGVCEAACYKLNKVFFTNHKNKRAFIKLKWAQSADGYIGETEKNIAISNSYSNIISHKYRTQIDSILVGYNTAKNDKPSLTSRHWKGKQPTRIFIDWDCELKEVLHKEPNSKTIVLNSKTEDTARNITYIKVAKSAKAIAEALYKHNIMSVLVEGGANTHKLFINEGIWDEAIVIKNKRSIKTDSNKNSLVQATALKNATLLNSKTIYSDTIDHYSNSLFIK